MAKNMKGVLKGPKINNSHSTIIEVAIPLVKRIKGWSEVTKIVLGEIRTVRPAKNFVKLIPVQAGFRLVVRGNSSLQKFFVYTKDQAGVERKINTAWEDIGR